MAQLELPDLIEKNRMEVARQTAQAIKESNLPGLSQLTVEQLTRNYLLALDSAARYLRNNDVNEWREYLVATSRTRQQSGVTAEAMKISIGTIVAKTVEMIEKKLAGPENAAVRARYISRVNALGGLINASMLGTYYKKD